jgi:hypothetical protein
MLRPALLAILAVGAAPALADPPAGHEVTIPRMSHFLEWRADGTDALYVRADTGRWYHVRTQGECPRLASQSSIRFNASPSDRLDRSSTIGADGWRCMIASIAESDGPSRAAAHGRHR